MPATVTPDQAYDLIDYYNDGHQIEFVRECLGRNPWSIQEQIIQAVFKYPVVAVASCNAAGKSDVASDVALTFLTIKPGSIVITTAPTWRQVKDVLWRYVRDKYAKAPIKLSDKQCNQVGLDLAEDWFAVGLSTKDSEKFFGYHADDILVIVDEASGVEEEIYIGVDAVTPNLNAHVLLIGNPTNPDGRFKKAFDDPMVKKFRISVFDTPNFTANNIASLPDLLRLFDTPEGIEPIEHLTKIQKTLTMPIPALISPSTVYRRYLQWGEDHPMWDALIMGEFPKQASASLIPLYLIEKSVAVWKQLQAAKKDPEYRIKPEWTIPQADHKEYGLDIARFGDDTTVLFERMGGLVSKPSTWSKQDTSVTTERVLSEIDLLDTNAVIKTDDTGLGGGVTDQLRKAKQDNERWHYKIVPINFAEGTTNPRKYFNLRTEMYDNLAEQFRKQAIAIPDDDELIAELAGIRISYEGKEKNVLKVESKDDMKKRLKRSPDKSDALMLAFYGAKSGKWLAEDDELDVQRRYEERLTPITADLDNRY